MDSTLKARRVAEARFCAPSTISTWCGCSAVDADAARDRSPTTVLHARPSIRSTTRSPRTSSTPKRTSPPSRRTMAGDQGRGAAPARQGVLTRIPRRRLTPTSWRSGRRGTSPTRPTTPSGSSIGAVHAAAAIQRHVFEFAQTSGTRKSSLVDPSTHVDPLDHRQPELRAPLFPGSSHDVQPGMLRATSANGRPVQAVPGPTWYCPGPFRPARRMLATMPVHAFWYANNAATISEATRRASPSSPWGTPRCTSRRTDAGLGTARTKPYKVCQAQGVLPH